MIPPRKPMSRQTSCDGRWPGPVRLSVILGLAFAAWAVCVILGLAFGAWGVLQYLVGTDRWLP